MYKRQTLEFTIGRGTVLPGFERAVIGMVEGETRRATVPAEDAYGPYLPEKIFRMKRSEVLPEAEPIGVGDVVRIAGTEEGEFFAVVREMDSTGVLLDANHPLCGQDITFEIQLLEVTVPGAAPYRNGAIHAAG